MARSGYRVSRRTLPPAIMPCNESQDLFLDAGHFVGEHQEVKRVKALDIHSLAARKPDRVAFFGDRQAGGSRLWELDRRLIEREANLVPKDLDLAQVGAVLITSAGS